MILHKIQETDMNYLVIILVALSQGITGLSDLAINYLYKDDLKLEPSQVSRINSLATLPWVVKPIYGLISDSFPIFSYRRKPYLFIFGFMSIICWILMSVWVDNIYKVVTIVIVNQISIAFCNVIGEALVVETSQKQRLLDPDASAKNVSMYFMVKSIGSLLTAFSSGALLEVMDKRNVFLITACFPFMMVLSSILLIEKRLGDKSEDNGEEDPEVSQILNLSTTTKNLNDNYDTINTISDSRSIRSASILSENPNVLPPRRSAPKQGLKDQLDLLFSLLRNDRIYKPVIFIFLFMMTPSYSDPLFYFYTDVLKFSPIIMGRLKLIYGVASVLGILLYNKVLKNVGFKKIVFYTTILYIFFNLLTIVLVLRLNRRYGISDFYFCMTADALTTALGEINTMPLLVLACNICPKNIEGTLYAFLMSVINLGYLFSTQLGASLTVALGITNNNFDNLATLILIANLVLILPMPGLYLIDEGDYSSNNNDNNKDSSEKNIEEKGLVKGVIDHERDCNGSTDEISRLDNSEERKLEYSNKL